MGQVQDLPGLILRVNRTADAVNKVGEFIQQIAPQPDGVPG